LQDKGTYYTESKLRTFDGSNSALPIYLAVCHAQAIP
jgi:hypothetical protein